MWKTMPIIILSEENKKFKMWSEHQIEDSSKTSQMPGIRSRTNDGLNINSYGKVGCLEFDFTFWFKFWKFHWISTFIWNKTNFTLPR